MIIYILITLISLIGYSSYSLCLSFGVSLPLSVLISLIILFAPLFSTIFRYAIISKPLLILINWILYGIFALFSTFIILSFFRDIFILLINLVNFLSVILDSNIVVSAEIFTDSFAITLMVILTIVISAYGVFKAFNPIVKYVDIKSDRISSKLSGTKIIQISDIHISYLIGKRFVLNMVNLIEKEEPDIILLTGDLADGNVDHFKEEIDLLRKLNPRYGKYFVTGNHEYYNNMNKIVSMAEKVGFIVLKNSGVNIDSLDLYIGGVNDFRASSFKFPKSDVKNSLENYNGKGYKILMAHQPKSFEESLKSGYDLTVSGHTHGGQFFPFNFFVYLDQPYLKGLYEKEGAKLYVNQGTGFWGPPLRVGTFGEITVIKLL
ncbi:MAG: hypothetical protein CR982_04775 [Candidatus Cloacimonadota bacterium]|nr:MAG: hypothetical protein CR982_04775 [Candidatus Cloacimonadota bacterium]PIE81762.1 MAG: hypothetical protein CSA15_00400 [Candidatus Delongbacteria bacterium]